MKPTRTTLHGTQLTPQSITVRNTDLYSNFITVLIAVLFRQNGGEVIKNFDAFWTFLHDSKRAF